MGWTFTNGQTRAELIAELTDPDEAERIWRARPSWRTLAKSYRGGPNAGTLYAVREKIDTGERYILVALLRSSPDGWGYKDMDCCSGPAEDTCPIAYLAMVPPHEGREYCAEWHGRCRKRAELSQSRRAIRPGSIIRTGNYADPFTVLERRGSTLIVTGNGYDRARLSTRYVTG